MIKIKPIAKFQKTKQDTNERSMNSTDLNYLKVCLDHIKKIKTKPRKSQNSVIGRNCNKAFNSTRMAKPSIEPIYINQKKNENSILSLKSSDNKSKRDKKELKVELEKANILNIKLSDRLKEISSITNEGLMEKKNYIKTLEKIKQLVDNK